MNIYKYLPIEYQYVPMYYTQISKNDCWHNCIRNAIKKILHTEFFLTKP